MRKTYQGIETSFYLMKSYEFLSISHSKTFSELDRNIDEENSINYYNCFALINLNSGIIEGLLRSILVEKIEREYDNQIELNNSIIISSILQKARYEIETQGGWEKLQEQFSTYLKINLKIILGVELFQSLKILFKLRNIFVHGTTLVEPCANISDDDKDYYPYKWQTNLQEVSDYCQKNFRKDSIINALALYDFPIHFFEKTKALGYIMKENFSGLHPRIDNVIHEISVVKFGKKKLYNFL